MDAGKLGIGRANLSDLALRTFEYRDSKQILEIERASFPNPYSKIVFTLFRLKAGEGFTVACLNGGVVGYLISEYQRGQGHIVSMAVSPEFRRRGIGEALVNESIRRLAGKVKKVQLEVRANNEEAIRLYHKLSFRETGGTRKAYYPGGEDAIIMAREI